MTLANETDPVETLALALDDNTSSTDWSNAGDVKPSHIEALEASTQKIKNSRGDPAIYIWVPDVGDIQQFGATYEFVNETYIAQCEVWDKDSADRAEDYTRDIRSILSSYNTDNKSSTNWNEIAPVGDIDNRGMSQAARRSDHYVKAIQVKLMARRSD